MRTLVVEDERSLAKAISFTLGKGGYEVDVTNDGDAGHDAIFGSEYDGIVMDIMMPGRSGLDLLQEMRDVGDETPVLLLTALDGLDDKIRGLGLGADDYLTKPFELKELVARVNAMTRRRSATVNVAGVCLDRQHGTMSTTAVCFCDI